MSAVNQNSEVAPTRRDWMALAVLSIGLGLIVLDGTIVGVALPVIIGDLQLNITDAQWINSLYAVLLAALLLSTGNLADRWGRKKVFLIGIVVTGLDPVIGQFDGCVCVLNRGVGVLRWSLLAESGKVSPRTPFCQAARPCSASYVTWRTPAETPRDNSYRLEMKTPELSLKKATLSGLCI